MNAGRKRPAPCAFLLIISDVPAAFGTHVEPACADWALRRSFVKLGLLLSAPDMSKLYLEEFLPDGAAV